MEVLSEAKDLNAVQGETAGEVVAVIEHLLAICFASGTCPSSNEEWRSWIEEEHELTKAARWLARRPDDQWDLFHPETPLGQNSLLAEDLRECGTGPAQLVIEYSGDYHQHFDHHSLAHPARLPAARAFRSMLTQHLYGLGGRARVSDNKLGPTLTNLAAGRLQSRIRVLALGRNLAETLRLNLYPPDGPIGELNRSWTSGTVTRRGFKTKPPPREVRGPADLHSYLGRSVLLRPALAADGTSVVVDRVLLGAGELIELDPQRHLHDAVMRTRLNGEDKPLWASPTRALWRDAHALYSSVKDAHTGMYALLRSLKGRGTGDSSAPYKLWAVGLLANKTVNIAWTDGAYPYGPGMEKRLYVASKRGSDIADRLARGLELAAVVVREIIHPNPVPSEKKHLQAQFDARWEFWPAAEEPFDKLLDNIAEGDPVPESLLEYAETLLDLTWTFLRQRLDKLPRNSKGNRARALAEQRLAKHLTSATAPAELRGETAHDVPE